MAGESGILSGGRWIDKAALDERIARAAQALESLGVGDGDSVAWMLRNDIPVFEATLGARTLGAYNVPVNWHFRGDEAGYILRDCGAKVLVIHADLLPAVAHAVPPDTTILVVPTPPEIAAAYGIDEEACRPSRDARLWDDWLAGFAPWRGAPRPQRPSMIYTSGTTGRPKGVRRLPAADAGQQALMARIRESVFGLRPGMRAAITGPIYHAAPHLYAIAAAQYDGFVVLQPRFDAEALLGLIEAHRITHLHMVPTMFGRLLGLPAETRRRHDLSSLQYVVHGAAPCPRDVKLAMIDWLGPIVHEYYGGTETGPVTACRSRDSLERPGTVGRAVETATLRILDESGGPLGPGEVGEVYMRLGAYPDFTYHGRDDERGAVERDGLIGIGDMGYLDEDGYLFLCDRKIDMVISGGVNIYPAEIEAVLLAMPGVRDCAVFGIPDAEFGEALVALIVPEPDAPLEREDVESFLRERQAGYKTPKVIEFREALPREDSGKIFKRKLREPYWAGTGRSI